MDDIQPDFMDYPIEFYLCLKYKENSDFYREIRQTAIKKLCDICQIYNFVDYELSIISKIIDDFIIIPSDNISTCILTKCPCIYEGISILEKIKEYITNVDMPYYTVLEMEVKKNIALSDAAISRITDKNKKDMQRKSRKFIAKAEEVNINADKLYYEMELIKRIYSRELRKLRPEIQKYSYSAK